MFFFENKPFAHEQFLEDLQQSLILKDVFVDYAEIKIDSQIGEGSFGVVYKATFRGAQVLFFLFFFLFFSFMMIFLGDIHL